MTITKQDTSPTFSWNNPKDQKMDHTGEGVTPKRTLSCE